MTAFAPSTDYTAFRTEVYKVSGYAYLVMILNFVVELLLLLGADRLYGHLACWDRILLGAGISGVYAGACLLLRFSFLCTIVGRFTCLVLVVWIAYGFSVSALRRGAVFILLNMALDGIASGFSKESVWYLLIGAAIILVMYVIGFRGRESGEYIPVELTYGGRSLHLIALRDTGNTLRDPVTGRSVMIVAADAAQKLTGLTPQQLASPMESIISAGVPGLRLIPYHTVGERGGFLLGLKIPQSKIGDRKGSCLVAFAPNGLDRKGTYQALTGGVI